MRSISAIGVALVVFALGAFAQPVPARQVFAYALAAARIAEAHCDVPGEMERAQRWVERFRSGFDPMQSKEDAILLLSTGTRIDAHRLRLGIHAWCVEYRSKRNFSPY